MNDRTSKRPVPGMALMVILVLATGAGAAEILKYEFTGATLAPTQQNFNATGTAIANGGALVTYEISNLGYTSDPELRVSPPSSTTTAAAAVANGAYYSFTLTPGASDPLTLTSLGFQAARGGGGTRGWVLRSSLDNYAANLGTSDIATQRPTFTSYDVPLGSAFENLASPVTFRLYVYTGSSTSTLEFDNITVNGDVPEPGTMSGAAGVAVMLLARRRRASRVPCV